MKDPQQEFDEELQFHLDERVRDYIAKRVSPDAARKAAAERFGNIAGVREPCIPVLVAERAAEGRRKMFTVGILAALGPARPAVQPTEALRDE